MRLGSPGPISIGKPEHPDGERPARDGLGSEFTWLMRRAQPALARPSKLVPLGRAFLSSTWLRSQEPFRWDCLTSQQKARARLAALSPADRSMGPWSESSAPSSVGIGPKSLPEPSLPTASSSASRAPAASSAAFPREAA